MEYISSGNVYTSKADALYENPSVEPVAVEDVICPRCNQPTCATSTDGCGFVTCACGASVDVTRTN